MTDDIPGGSSGGGGDSVGDNEEDVVPREHRHIQTAIERQVRGWCSSESEIAKLRMWSYRSGHLYSCFVQGLSKAHFIPHLFTAETNAATRAYVCNVIVHMLPGRLNHPATVEIVWCPNGVEINNLRLARLQTQLGERRLISGIQLQEVLAAIETDPDDSEESAVVVSIADSALPSVATTETTAAAAAAAASNAAMRSGETKTTAAVSTTRGASRDGRKAATPMPLVDEITFQDMVKIMFKLQGEHTPPGIRMWHTGLTLPTGSRVYRLRCHGYQSVSASELRLLLSLFPRIYRLFVDMNRRSICIDYKSHTEPLQSIWALVGIDHTAPCELTSPFMPTLPEFVLRDEQKAMSGGMGAGAGAGAGVARGGRGAGGTGGARGGAGSKSLYPAATRSAPRRLDDDRDELESSRHQHPRNQPQQQQQQQQQQQKQQQQQQQQQQQRQPLRPAASSSAASMFRGVKRPRDPPSERKRSHAADYDNDNDNADDADDGSSGGGSGASGAGRDERHKPRKPSKRARHQYQYDPAEFDTTSGDAEATGGRTNDYGSGW